LLGIGRLSRSETLERIRFLSLFVVVFGPLASPICAESLGDDWTAKKCELYRSASDDAAQIQGTEGVSESLISQSEAFIAGGCTGDHGLCPVTDQDRALIDLLTVLTMNEGMASTFVPLGC
jgi:hypothetical protein